MVLKKTYTDFRVTHFFPKTKMPAIGVVVVLIGVLAIKGRRRVGYPRGNIPSSNASLNLKMAIIY